VRHVARQKNIGLVGTTHEVLVERPASAATCCRPARGPTRLPCSKDQRSGIGSYRRVRFTGTTGSTFTALAARAREPGARRPVAVTNVTLEVVQREYHSLREGFPKFCGCETCHSDVVVYGSIAFPRTTSPPARARSSPSLTLASDQEKAKLDVALLEGFRKVSAAPRCGAKPTQL